MAVLQMEKYRFVVHKNEAPKLIALIHDLGITELTKVSDDTLQSNELNFFEHHRNSSRLDTALGFLSKHHKDTGLKALLEGGKIEITQKELESRVANFNFEVVINETQRLETELNSADRNLNRLADEYHLLYTWERLELPLDVLMETKFTNTISLRGAARNIESFLEALDKKTNLVAFKVVSDTTLMVSYLKENQETIHELVSANTLEKVTLPKNEGTVADALQKIKEDKEKTIQTKLALEESSRKLALEHIYDLKLASNYYLWKKEELDLALTAPSTNHVSIFEAWLPKDLAGELKSTIEKSIPHADLTICQPFEGEVPPTEIENNKFLSPFETVTRLYGLPTHQDLDPTPFLSIFFFIFFGLSLGDVGYGLTLMAITGTLLWKYRLEKTVKQLIGILFYGGLGSAFAGILLGGYLGIDIESLPPLLQKLQLFDPISSPLPIFYLSLALGFAHISFGIILKIKSQALNGDLLGGIMDNGPWLVLFSGILLMVLNQFGVLSQLITTSSYAWVNWIIYAGLGLLVLTQGRSQKSILGKIFFGVLSLYNIISYFADTLSYSRLLALGLGTTALSFSINMIAQFMGSLLPSYLGMLVTILILIAGHTLNITISILSAFIHSARLQFVEFFSKFLIGSGRTFKPFFKQERDVILLPLAKNKVAI